MSQPFPILQLRTDSPEVVEQLGSKPKFWFRNPHDNQPWLFKYTRVNTGEDWSEKIASEIAHRLSIPAAKVELAQFMGKRGCASRSFIETKKGFELIHGSEVLAGRVFGYDKSKQRHQSDHCLPNIIQAIEETFPRNEQTVQLECLAGYMVLDAVICNTDRHHDNWGLVRGPFKSGLIAHQLAPSFDHASSLGRELLDPRRKELLSKDMVGRYISNGRGGIYWQNSDLKGANPMELTAMAAKVYPHYFRSALGRIRDVQFETFCEIVERVPNEWMSLAAKRFCIKLLSETTSRLTSLNQ
jgi:hypothetical protein